MAGPLDVNVLVALSWPEHEAFARSHRWFARHAAAGWATCPITQAGFVRVVCNPAFSIRMITPREALANLAITMKHSGHHFWRDDISLVQATEPFAARMVGGLCLFAKRLLRVAASDQRHSLFDACAAIDVAGRYRKTLAGPLPSVSVL
jgi:hypothetical protein